MTAWRGRSCSAQEGCANAPEKVWMTAQGQSAGHRPEANGLWQASRQKSPACRCGCLRAGRMGTQTRTGDPGHGVKLIQSMRCNTPWASSLAARASNAVSVPAASIDQNSPANEACALPPPARMHPRRLLSRRVHHGASVCDVQRPQPVTAARMPSRIRLSKFQPKRRATPPHVLRHTPLQSGSEPCATSDWIR
ncbi:hypothetical protein bAD24_III10610 [Burkholderia sp. AD24]|nr:hypothetical protein bAD24_III10610 [Burkholderia sp. AD24]